MTCSEQWRILGGGFGEAFGHASLARKKIILGQLDIGKNSKNVVWHLLRESIIVARDTFAIGLQKCFCHSSTYQ